MEKWRKTLENKSAKAYLKRVSAMTKCYQTSIEFPSVKSRKVVADFTGGDITSNGGLPLLAQVDRQTGVAHLANIILFTKLFIIRLVKIYAVLPSYHRTQF